MPPYAVDALCAMPAITKNVEGMAESTTDTEPDERLIPQVLAQG